MKGQPFEIGTWVMMTGKVVSVGEGQVTVQLADGTSICRAISGLSCLPVPEKPRIKKEGGHASQLPRR